MVKSIYSTDYEYLIKRLKQARKEAGLDQLKVAKLLGKTQSYVSKIESGQLRLDIIQLKSLAKIYKKKIEFFIS